MKHKTMTFKGKTYPVGQHDQGEHEDEKMEVLEEELQKELEELIELAAFKILEEGVEELKKRIPKHKQEKDEEHVKICSGCSCGEEI